MKATNVVKHSNIVDREKRSEALGTGKLFSFSPSSTHLTSCCVHHTRERDWVRVPAHEIHWNAKFVVRQGRASYYIIRTAEKNAPLFDLHSPLANI